MKIEHHLEQDIREFFMMKLMEGLKGISTPPLRAFLFPTNKVKNSKYFFIP
jgi:hypothetical protein